MKKLLIILLFSSFCFAQENNFLDIYVAEMKPCVIVDDGEVSGFEIDLWNTISAELQKEGLIDGCEYHIVDWKDIEKNVRESKADVAFSGLTIRSYRMDWADFSIPTLNSGLGIMVLKDHSNQTVKKIKIFFEAISGPFFIFSLFILFFANLILFAERKSDLFDKRYFIGIFQAIYFCVVTASTVGYGDYTAKKVIGKLIVIILIFAGIIAFCNFTALLSADYTTEKMEGEIRGPEDLKGKNVMTAEGTTSVNYIAKLGATPKEALTIDYAIDGLLLGRADAVVFDYPVLVNYHKYNADKVTLIPGIFDKQYYGFVFPKDSELKNQVDKIILKLYEDGTYEKIYKKWF
jgi:polar amino acid transport system substrate-binding protein